MSFQKNTVDFLKDYAIRYKKILLTILGIAIFILSSKLYQEYSLWQFNKNLNVVNKQIDKVNNFQHLNKFFNKYNSKWINHRSIFILGFCYLKYIEILLKEFSNNKEIKALIESGQWMKIKSIYKGSNGDLIKTLDNLEQIYQFTLKNVPYHSVLNGKDLNFYGEVLNLLIFIHVIQREKQEKIIYFFHKGCLNVSLYCNYTKILYTSVIDPTSKSDLFIYNDNNISNLIKKIINF